MPFAQSLLATMLYDANSPGPSGGGGPSQFRKLVKKPPPLVKPGPMTLITARRTEYPPGSPHGSGLTPNVQLGVRLKRGIAHPKEVMLDAWSTSSLREAIRIAAKKRAHPHCLTNLT